MENDKKKDDTTPDPEVDDEDDAEVDQGGDKLCPEIDPTVKHPLQNSWTMWYNPASKASSTKAWTSNVREIWTFTTVEDFWRLFNNLVPPSRLPQGSNYHMFKTGVQPEWEDPFNAKGGKWVLTMQNKGEENTKKFDDAWMWVVLACIGELFDDSDHISGVVISPRSKNNRIALWTIDAQNEDACKRIGTVFKQNLNVQTALGFQCHNDSLKHGGYRNVAMYQV